MSEMPKDNAGLIAEAERLINPMVLERLRQYIKDVVLRFRKAQFFNPTVAHEPWRGVYNGIQNLFSAGNYKEHGFSDVAPRSHSLSDGDIEVIAKAIDARLREEQDIRVE
jgi:hypothetical protein